MAHKARTWIVAAFAIASVALVVQRVLLADAHSAAHADAATVAPAEALQRLMDGNQRFVDGKTTPAHEDAARRDEVAKGQKPFAVVLGCADSRVPPELIFDQGLGDLFVVRVAGEVASPEVIGSIEYAVEHLGARAVVVLGHERCGAVKASLDSVGQPAPEGNLGELLKEIAPVTAKIDKTAPDALDNAINANAKAIVANLSSRSKLLSEMSGKGELAIVAARYDLDTSKVEIIDARATPTSAAPGADAHHAH